MERTSNDLLAIRLVVSILSLVAASVMLGITISRIAHKYNAAFFDEYEDCDCIG